MRKLSTILGFGRYGHFSIRMFNVVVAGTLAVATAGSMMSLFFIVCMAVAMADRPQRKEGKV